jgi:hypothetical protein
MRQLLHLLNKRTRNKKLRQENGFFLLRVLKSVALWKSILSFFTSLLCSFCVLELFTFIRKEKFVCYFASYRLSCIATPTLFFPSVRNLSHLLPPNFPVVPLRFLGENVFFLHVRSRKLSGLWRSTRKKTRIRKVWGEEVGEPHRNWSGVLCKKKDDSFSEANSQWSVIYEDRTIRSTITYYGLLATL